MPDQRSERHLSPSFELLKRPMSPVVAESQVRSTTQLLMQWLHVTSNGRENCYDFISLGTSVRVP